MRVLLPRRKLCDDNTFDVWPLHLHMMTKYRIARIGWSCIERNLTGGVDRIAWWPYRDAPEAVSKKFGNHGRTGLT